MNRPDDGWQERWQLTPAEVATLRAMQLRMMRCDVDAERKDKRAGRKAEQLAAFADATSNLLTRRPDGCAAAPNGAAPSVDDIIAVAADSAATITDRSRSVLVLVELLTFHPWTDGITWVPKVRNAAIAHAANELPGLEPDDLTTLKTELDAVTRELRRKSIKWGRVATITALGLGAGVLTGGLAAPAVGAAVGGTLGLSGAAATSAGLAALGGGSLAAGGFGVAGGTLLVTGVGGLAGASAAGAGTLYSRFGSTGVGIEAIKLDLLARLLLADAEDRDQKMRRVAESLQQVANDLGKKVNLLSERIVQLKERNRALIEENNVLRAKIAQLGTEVRQLRDTELRQLEAELDAARHDMATVEVVRDRLQEKVSP